MRKRPSFAELFWAKVDKSTPEPVHVPGIGNCWSWTASVNRGGYGTVNFNGRSTLAHRVSWDMHKEPRPPNLFVLHRCDNRRCVNPEHLFLGTHTDNALDMVAKKRIASRAGANNIRAKIKDCDVIALRIMFAAGETGPAISRRTGLPLSIVQNALSGRTWSHLFGSNRDLRREGLGVVLQRGDNGRYFRR